MRVGLGYDIHRLVKGRKLFLGGVEIPYEKGLLGYSDGDVILHALSDALLGAIGKGDIGEHFPNNEPKYKDIASREILNFVFKLVLAKRFIIRNLDITLIAEHPEISKYKEKMKKNIGGILRISRDNINIKATTHEGIGSIGKGEAMAAWVVVLLDK
ncbi:MAG: 2-C-methyl-D-erythritol 2,4-cyclodiphosphate synthase [Candidatus Omnitrophica bacterium]|nr:2-C-methyl-D-erythritol 2,4-cyclodiphosphate synthase [Candidatus Omnitrophota bacterium]